MTTCPKCNYTRQPSDTAPDYECPRCGIVYAKYSAERPAPAPASAGRGTVGHGAKALALAVLLVALGGGWALMSGSERASDQRMQQPVAPVAAAEQQAAREQLEEELAARQQALAEQQAIEQAIAAILVQHRKWSDASTLAGSTGRIALAGPVATLQALYRDTEAMTVPPCLERAKNALVSGMDMEVRGFVTFMQHGELLSRVHFADARDWFGLHQAAMSECDHLRAEADLALNGQ